MSEIYVLRLIIENNGSEKNDTYTARWVETDGQESRSFPLALPLTDDDMAELRWYLETYMQLPGAGDRKRAEGIEARMETWGRQLFDAVFGTAEGAHFHRNLLDREREGCRCLLTLGAEDASVLGQPWEMMRDERGPLAFRGITVRRQLRGAKTFRAPKFSLPLRILLIVSRPSDVGFIDPRNSIPPVLDALEKLPGRADVTFCDPPTLKRLEQIVSEARKNGQPFHIVHFDGHGTYLPRTGVGALCFEDDDGKNKLVKGIELGDLLQRLEIPLVILEACRSADLSDRPVFGSVAPALLKSGVGSVAAFSHAVHVKAARILVERFYRELASGMTVGQSLDEARSALMADPLRWLHPDPDADVVDLKDWFIPQLYQTGPDPAIVAKDASPGKGTQSRVRPEARIRERMRGFPPPPMYRFHGRALELLDLERIFRKHPAVVVTGMGGMGKTALAREAAHWWIRKGLFDAAVFVSFENKAGAEQAVLALGNALEEDFGRLFPEDRWDRAVDLFHERRVLVVWDNFESTLPMYQRDFEGENESDTLSGDDAANPFAFTSQDRVLLVRLFRELTQDRPEGRILVTCRPQETGLPGIREFPLEGLKSPDALHLLAAILDQKGVEIEGEKGYERPEIDALLKDLDYHPLSVELVAPHLKKSTPKEIRKRFGQLLEQFKDDTAFEGRNRSLLASLRFSRSRLGPEARNVLPWLAWFRGGVFEPFLLAFTQLDPDVWDSIKAELAATALVKAEDEGIQINDRPWLRFHPTLPYTAWPSEVPDAEAAKERFVDVYLGASLSANLTLHGAQPAGGMTLLAREEANVRKAMALAFEGGRTREAWSMADTIRNYLQMAGRLRERDDLVSWVRGNLAEESLSTVYCGAVLDHAWTLFLQGRGQEAVDAVQGLIERLKNEEMEDEQKCVGQLARCHTYLGRIFYHAGRGDLALAPLEEAIQGFEKLGESSRGNLSVALLDLVNGLISLGRLDQALDAAEQALQIDRELGNNRSIATGLGTIARILMEQRRYAEADSMYQEAFQVARSAGDLELQGGLLQQRGGLQNDMGNYDRAVESYKKAMDLFQRSGDMVGEMQTCDLLGTAENNRGQLEAAEAWHERSRDIAEKLGDKKQLGGVAQNIGVLFQKRAEGFPEGSEERMECLRRAAASVEESLGIKVEMEDRLGAARSYFQLGVLYFEMDRLDEAEENLVKGMEIFEPLDYLDVWKVYYQLARIARARCDDEAAARWQAKFEAKHAQVERLKRGEGANPGRLPEEVAKMLLALARTAHQARVTRSALAPQSAEILAQLETAPPPFPAVAAFLKVVAEGGEVPPVPEGLPGEIEELLGELAKAEEEK